MINKLILKCSVLLSTFLMLISAPKAFCSKIDNPASNNSAKEATGILLDSLSRTAIKCGGKLNIPLSEFRNFSTLALGTDISFEYEFLAQFIPNVTTGSIFSLGFQNFTPYRQEIESLVEGSIMQGLWFRFYLPRSLMLQTDFSLGFAFIHLNAQSVDSELIDDVYYDFMLNTNLSVRKEFSRKTNCNLFWSVDIPFTVQCEKSNIIPMVGISLSIIVKFEPLAKRK